MRTSMKLGLLCLGVVSALSSAAQGTYQWTVTFDGAPRIDRNSELGIDYYNEKGMTFRPIQPNEQFGRAGGDGGLGGWFPYNDSAYLHGAFMDSLSLTGSPSRFGLVSVDLAEFSTLYQTPLTVQFIGYKADGSTVTTEFVTDGVIDGTGPLADFQTFYFDARFWDVVRVEIPRVVTTTSGWSLDSMVFSFIPEPGTGALLVVGFALLSCWRIRQRRPAAKEQEPSRTD